MYKKILIVLFAFLFPAIFFAPSLFDWNNVLLFRDLGRDFLQQKILWANSVRSGESIPYWNYFSLGGVPYYAMNVVGALHPLNIIFLFFSAEHYSNALTFFLYTHYVILFFGSYYFVRSFHYAKAYSITFALPIAFCGYSISAYCLPHILGSLVTVPFFFGFLLRWKENKSWTFFLGMSVSAAFPIYAGDPQFTLILCSVFFIIAFTQIPEKFSKKISLVLFFYFSVFLFSAAQLLPTLELALSTERARSQQLYSTASLWSLHPARILEYIFPHFWGTFYPQLNYKGENYISFPGNTPFILSLYCGSLFWACLLILHERIFHLLHWRNLKKNIHWLLLAIISIALPIGIYFPIDLNFLFFQYFPFWNFFRYPERLLFWPQFILYCWILKNFRPFLDAKKEIPKKIFLTYIFVIAIFSSILLFWVPFSRSVLVFALFLLSTLFVFFRMNANKSKTGKNNYLFPTALIIIGLIDLNLASQPVIWLQDKTITESATYPLVNKIHTDLSQREKNIREGAAFRFSNMKLPSLHSLGKMENWSSPWPTQHILSAWESMEPNIPMYFQISTIHGFYTILPIEKIHFINTLGSKNPALLWNVMGVYYIPERGHSDKPILQTNPSAYPYLSIMNNHNLYFARDYQESLQAVLAGKNTIEHSPKKIEAGTTANWKFSILEKTNRRMRISIEPTSNAFPIYLLWNESFDPHWKVYWENRRLNTYRANAWATAIELPQLLPQEQQELIFAYENDLILYGQWITIIWIYLLIGLYLWKKIFFKHNGKRSGKTFLTA